MSRLTPFVLTLPDGITEEIPLGVLPCRRDSRWFATTTVVSVADVALYLARAEEEAVVAIERRDYLRGLMARILAAGNAPSELPRTSLAEGVAEEAARIVDKVGTPEDGATHEELNKAAIKIRCICSAPPSGDS